MKQLAIVGGERREAPFRGHCTQGVFGRKMGRNISYFLGKGGVNCAVLLKSGKHLINRSKGKGGKGGRKKSCERKEEGVREEEEVGVEKVSSCEWEDGGEKRGGGRK